MSDFKPLPINADRICEAISKIGYNPCSAILDIIDNSVVAKATQIIVLLFIKDSTTINNTQNIEKIQILDSGCGMTNLEIDNALQLGSISSYSKNSLSKYGLGLKSAGFSLGKRIEVVSKKEGQISKLKYLDRELIKKENAFGISIKDVTQEYIELFDLYKFDKSGTIVTIKDIIYTSRVSAGRVLEDLNKQAGVHYYEILKSGNISIKINILKQLNSGKYQNEKEKIIIPKDILFWDQSYSSYEKETYDGKKPCQVLDSEIENPLNSSGDKIGIKATIFPMDKMKNFAHFSPEEREIIKSFEIGYKNNGFFFYRNGRLIKWGLKLLENLNINRELGFRAKINFTTEHDDLFGVDVSKQQLTIPEDIEKAIQMLCKVPIEQSKELFDICKRIIEDSSNKKNEGTEFNMRNSSLEEDEEETTGTDQKEATERKIKLLDESETLFQTDESKFENEKEEEGFKRIRYWENPKCSNLWESGIDRTEGTYVLINKNHPFYNQTLNRLAPGSAPRQAIEALIHSLAVGQNQAIQKVSEIEYDIVKNAFNKYLRLTSHQLDNWVNNNWDLFEDGNKSF